MRVILLQDIRSLGRKWDVKRVPDGYARNFLLPRGIVKLATQDALDELEETVRQREAEATHELHQFADLAEELDGFEVVISAKADEGGNLYAAVDAKIISARLKELDFNVPEKVIQLAQPIKEIGEYKIRLEFDHGLEAELKLDVEAQKETLVKKTKK